MLELYRMGKLPLGKLITRRYSLDDLDHAFADMLTGQSAKGVLLHVSAPSVRTPRSQLQRTWHLFSKSR